MTTELTQEQRNKRQKQAHTAIANALAASWTEWRRTGRRPDFTKAADYAMDGLGDLAAEILADGTMLKALTVKDGMVCLDLEPATEMLKLFVATMRGVLHGYGAENYVETEMQAPSVSMDLRDSDTPYDSYTVTIQRREGTTPHQFRQQAEARVAELETQMANARKLVDGWRQASDEHAKFAQSKVMDEYPGMSDKQDGRSNQLADCANELNDVLNGENPDDWEYGIGLDVTEASDRDG
ncbi:hypothetical protein [Streptomyces pseudovenezuelae]|uniref:hypothetical protein n=1 Tax=Streptomyces pseudovenezuelae TaxID=67350 RepID=UPI0036E59BC5